MNRLVMGSFLLLALGIANLLLLDGHFAPKVWSPGAGSGTVDPLPSPTAASSAQT